MGLLLDAAYQGKDRRDLLDADLVLRRVHQSPGAVAIVLYHAIDRNGQPHLLQNPDGHSGVVGSAVDEEEIGQVPKFLVPL